MNIKILKRNYTSYRIEIPKNSIEFKRFFPVQKLPIGLLVLFRVMLKQLHKLQITKI